MARVITITNQKGGVGKTTTSINLAEALTLSGKRCLLVDMDPQGNTTAGLGVEKKNLQKSIYDVLLETASLREIMIPVGDDNNGLKIAPASLSLAGAEVELISQFSRETRLRKAISEVSHDFDYVLIDSPPSLGLLTINGLTCAHGVLIPVQCEYYALEGLSQLLHTFDLVRKHLNPPLEIEGVLLTMFDSRLNLSLQVAEEVRNYFGDKVYDTVIPRNVKLSEAPGFGKGILSYDHTCKGAVAYMELGKELIRRTHNGQKPIENKGSEINEKIGVG